MVLPSYVLDVQDLSRSARIRLSSASRSAGSSDDIHRFHPGHQLVCQNQILPIRDFGHCSKRRRIGQFSQAIQVTFQKEIIAYRFPFAIHIYGKLYRYRLRLISKNTCTAQIFPNRAVVPAFGQTGIGPVK